MRRYRSTISRSASSTVLKRRQGEGSIHPIRTGYYYPGVWWTRYYYRGIVLAGMVLLLYREEIIPFSKPESVFNYGRAEAFVFLRENTRAFPWVGFFRTWKSNGKYVTYLIICAAASLKYVFSFCVWWCTCCAVDVSRFR